MLIKTAVFPGEIALRLGVSDCAIDEKRYTNEMLRCQYIAGCSNIVEGSVVVIMMARRVGFATVTSEFVSIRFRLAVIRMRGLCWAFIIC